ISMRTAFVALFLTLPLACAGDPAPERPSPETAAPIAASGDDSTATSAAARTSDWPQWRGPNRDGKSSETGLLHPWPKGGPKLLWNSREVNKGKNVGTGYASLAIANGRIYTLGDRDNAGYVVALDLVTGKQLWMTKFSPHYKDDGPRSTPTVDGNRVYALSP